MVSDGASKSAVTPVLARSIFNTLLISHTLFSRVLGPEKLNKLPGGYVVIQGQF